MADSSKWHIEVVVDYTCLLGEGPVWDVKRKLICWVDIINGVIHEYSPATNQFNTINVDQMIGAFAISTNEQYIAALQNGFAFINRENNQVSIIADPEPHLPGNRFNDGKCDPAGRFWAGTMPLSEDAAVGNVYALHNDLTVTTKITGVTISNGMAWSADHRTFYYIDTPTFEILAYDYDKANGHISNKRIVVKVPEKEGFPDGMTIDTEGKLWVAHWGGWQVARWDPETGKKLREIKLPVEKVTSCTFGGETFEDLYITSAKMELTPEALATQPLAGSLFRVRNSGFKGLPSFEFAV